MDKSYLKAEQIIELSAQHAYAAELLLQNNGDIVFKDETRIEGLYPLSTLLYTAIELLLKAYLFHSHKPVHRHMKLSEIIESNHELDLSEDDIETLKTLTKVQAFRKGIDYHLWENRAVFHVFCEKAMSCYTRLHDMMPLELDKEYIHP